MGNSEELLISITSSLSRAENDLRSLYSISEYEILRSRYIDFARKLKEMNGEILTDLDHVQERESYTGILDQL